MKRLNVFLFCLIAAVSSNAQEKNLFQTETGWLMFNTQEIVETYVGNINETAYKINVGADAKMVQTVYADQFPDYPPTEVDATIAGAGSDAELGTAGSIKGALVLPPASAAMSTNGGGFIVCLPACTTFSIDYSSCSRVMARILATTNPDADMSKSSANYELSDATGWKIINAKYASVFKYLNPGHGQWNKIETLNNGYDEITVKSDKPIYVWFQSCTKDEVYIHGIKVTVPESTVGIESVMAESDAVTKVYSVAGVYLGTKDNLKELPKGIYIFRNGNNSKVVNVQ